MKKMSKELETLTQALDNKIGDDLPKMLTLAIWAGIYIAIGATLYSLATAIDGPKNLLRFIGAVLFTVGLNLVVFKKAQLFTGNNLMFTNLLKKQASGAKVLRNWSVVYVGNLIGSLVAVTIIAIVFNYIEAISGHLLKISSFKTNYDFITAFTKAIYCNSLVCTAIYFAITMNTIPKKVIGIIIPITAFVYFGFEHSIANMFFIPLGLIFSEYSFIEATGLSLKNIIPVTFGNIVGGLIISLIVLSRDRIIKRSISATSPS